MRAPLGVMQVDGGGAEITSLGALDILAPKTVTPAVEAPAANAQTAVQKLQSNQTLTDAEKKILGISVTPTIQATVPQAAVPVVAQGSVNTNTIEGINAASGTTTKTDAVTPAVIKTVAVETKPDPRCRSGCIG